MQLTIGPYKFGVNQTELSVRQETLFSAVGQPYEQHIMWVAKGFLLTTLTTGDHTPSEYQNDLTQQENAMENAAVSYRDVNFLQDNGSNSSERLPTALAITGNRIRQVRFPRTTGPEYATERYFEIDIEAFLPALGSQLYALSFVETLSFRGGGPIYVFKRAVNRVPPQKQQVYLYTEYECTQSGVIVGYRAQLPPPPPKFPTALLRSPDLSIKSPERRGPNGYTSFETTYQYNFASATPLVARPTIWSGTGYA